jgi:hypothetical protein
MVRVPRPSARVGRRGPNRSSSLSYYPSCGGRGPDSAADCHWHTVGGHVDGPRGRRAHAIVDKSGLAGLQSRNSQAYSTYRGAARWHPHTPLQHKVSRPDPRPGCAQSSSPKGHCQCHPSPSMHVPSPRGKNDSRRSRRCIVSLPLCCPVTYYGRDTAPPSDFYAPSRCFGCTTSSNQHLKMAKTPFGL